jgi:hypothetical protein
MWQDCDSEAEACDGGAMAEVEERAGAAIAYYHILHVVGARRE